jgi:RNA polymerase sigma factor (TIGR02999 family)
MPQPPANDELDHLFPVIYAELKDIAAAYMRGERPGHTLQPTALVHEAYMRLFRKKGIEWANRTHVLAMAAKEMRRVLIDHARRRNAAKRPGGVPHVTFDEDLAMMREKSVGVLALHEALEKLATLDPRQAEIAVLRIFGGLTENEIADHFGLSERTIRDDWRVARAWLAREMAP